MRIKSSLFITILTILTLLIPGQVQASPAVPAGFWGTAVYADNSPISSGTVEAVVNNAVCGSITISAGKFGYEGSGPKLLVQGENLSGQKISFRIKTGNLEVMARETAEWNSSQISNINLSISENPPVQPPSNQGNTGGTTQSGGNSSQNGGASTPSGSNSSGSSSPSAPGNDTEVTPPTAPNKPVTQESVSSFTDVSAQHWAYQDIQTMLQKGLVKGMGNGSFAPNQVITRAQFTSLLVKVLGLKSAQGNLPFNDVASHEWYFQDINIAYQAGLIKGLGANQFAPQEIISREQMAVLIIQALNKTDKGSPLLADDQKLNHYTDSNLISPWARQSCAQAVQIGLIKGYSSSNLAPTNTATRAEAVVILKHFMDYAGLER